MAGNRSIEFFDAQFRRQSVADEYALNPFETLALPYVGGRVLDLGCGLCNLGLAAARRGARVLAVDASPTAVARVRERAKADGLAVRVEQADLSRWRIEESFDTIVAIGLVMFFPAPRALEILGDIRAHVLAGGIAVVNALVEGTTYLEMFEPGRYHLFAEGELAKRFGDWEILESRHQRFDAPGSTIKAFDTVIARRPAGAGCEATEVSRAASE